MKLNRNFIASCQTSRGCQKNGAIKNIQPFCGYIWMMIPCMDVETGIIQENDGFGFVQTEGTPRIRGCFHGAMGKDLTFRALLVVAGSLAGIMLKLYWNYYQPMLELYWNYYQVLSMVQKLELLSTNKTAMLDLGHVRWVSSKFWWKFWMIVNYYMLAALGNPIMNHPNMSIIRW